MPKMGLALTNSQRILNDTNASSLFLHDSSAERAIFRRNSPPLTGALPGVGFNGN
jgi:hypothetical protein